MPAGDKTCRYFAGGFFVVSGDNHMNFKKVDSSTIKCYVSNEEMAEYGITVDELMSDKSKARKFINYLLEMAKDEIGEIEINSMMTIQVQMIRDKGLLLTITSNFWSELPKELKESLIESMEEHLQQVMRETADGDEDGQNQEKMLENILDRIRESSSDGNRENTEQTGDGAEDADGPFGSSDRAVFVFELLDDVLTLCGYTSETDDPESCLMKDQGKFYLYVERSRKERFRRFCAAAMEYGKLYCAEEKRILLLKGRAECLIAEHAVKALRGISGGQNG